MTRSRPVIVGITGASGACYGVRILEMLTKLGIESHLVVTPPGVALVQHELGLGLDELADKATQFWDSEDTPQAGVGQGSRRCIHRPQAWFLFPWAPVRRAGRERRNTHEVVC